MAEKPIIFSTEMVRAILDGRKTQTRRVVKPQPDRYFEVNENPLYLYDVEFDKGLINAPYLPEDTIYVRETFYQYGEWFDVPQTDEYGGVLTKRTFIPQKQEQYPVYFMDTLPSDIKVLKGYRSGRGYYKRPSIYMPRSAARLFLRVTNVRVERLQDITEEDVLSEGFRMDSKSVINEGYHGAFKLLWDSINGKKYPWESNPWVWVIEFERMGQNA